MISFPPQALALAMRERQNKPHKYGSTDRYFNAGENRRVSGRGAVHGRARYLNWQARQLDDIRLWGTSAGGVLKMQIVLRCYFAENAQHLADML